MLCLLCIGTADGDALRLLGLGLLDRFISWRPSVFELLSLMRM